MTHSLPGYKHTCKGHGFHSRYCALNSREVPANLKLALVYKAARPVALMRRIPADVCRVVGTVFIEYVFRMKPELSVCGGDTGDLRRGRPVNVLECTNIDPYFNRESMHTESRAINESDVPQIIYVLILAKA